MNPQIDSDRSHVAPRPSRGSRPNAPPGQRVQSAQLQLQLMAKPSDQKAVLATINKFVKDLGGSDLVASARTVKLPVNLLPALS